MDDAMTAGTIEVAGAGGDRIEAYYAGPGSAGPSSAGPSSAGPSSDGLRGGVVLIHHLPGYDRWSKEVARRFAADGYHVLLPNLYSREAPGAEPDDAAAVARKRGGVPDERLVGDVAGAAAYLRGLPSANGKVAVIGHCSGGRQAVLAGCNLDLQGVIDCYGAYVVGTPPKDFPIQVRGLEDQLATLSCPLLGLFGAEDSYPSPEQVAELDRLLTEHGKQHELHSYEGAGHAFFCTDRPSYRQQQAVDGYSRIADFFARTIG